MGDMVTYRLTTGEGESQRTSDFPAIILRVWSQDCVNLEVFGDWQYKAHRFPTSVKLTTENGQRIAHGQVSYPKPSPEKFEAASASTEAPTPTENSDSIR
jgi:hypothetical protein